MDDRPTIKGEAPSAVEESRPRVEQGTPRQSTSAAHPVRLPRESADVFADAKAWAEFADAVETPDFLAAWLTLQCRMIAGAEAAAVFAEGMSTDAEVAFAPVALWPRAAIDMEPLRAAAEQAMLTRAAHVDRPAEGLATLAVPVARDGRVRMVVVMRLAGLGTRELRGISRGLQWGVGWLATRIADVAARDSRVFVRRAETALDLLAVANEHVRYEAAAMAIANELQTTLGVANVTIGLVRRGGRSPRVRLVAISRAAWFKRKSALIGELENAMGEALDQSTTIAVPEGPQMQKRIAVAHRAYAQAANMGAVATFVLTDHDGPCGALTIERREAEPFPTEAVGLCEMLATMIGPALVLKRRQRRWLSGRLVDWLATGTRMLLGHRHPSLKLAAIAIAAFLGYVTFAEGDFRISADAVLEGAIQRAAVVPFDGFLKEAPVRAGDIVEVGDPLAALDDRDLTLEALHWRSEYARLSQQQRAAMAELDRAEVALLVAQIEQARAQLELAEAKLARTVIEAPIGGVVIAGDLSQRLGAPVSQGDVLFEIAPLDAYRLAIEVDERDLRHIEIGQTGELLLAGRADARLPFEVTRITSVAKVVDGQNVFRIEGRLSEDAGGIRPGMEGVAKISVDSRSIGWIWTRSLIEWARVFVWKWTP